MTLGPNFNPLIFFALYDFSDRLSHMTVCLDDHAPVCQAYTLSVVKRKDAGNILYLGLLLALIDRKCI
jgi:hypothetical protein